MFEIIRRYPNSFAPEVVDNSFLFIPDIFPTEYSSQKKGFEVKFSEKDKVACEKNMPAELPRCLDLNAHLEVSVRHYSPSNAAVYADVTTLDLSNLGLVEIPRNLGLAPLSPLTFPIVLTSCFLF